MKRFAILAAAACPVIVASVAIASSTDAGGKAPFGGVWEATDVYDGSSMTMWIDEEKGGARFVIYDHIASIACPPDRAANIFGAGKVRGSVLIGNGSAWCLQETPSQIGQGSWTITHNASTDTLEDPDGNIWSRR